MSSNLKRHEGFSFFPLKNKRKVIARTLKFKVYYWTGLTNTWKNSAVL